MSSGGKRGGSAPSDGPTSPYVSRDQQATDKREHAGDRGRLDLSVPPPEMPATGHFAGYDIIGRLAMGGMAEILLARRPNAVNQYVVVKRILDHFKQDRRFLDMFLDEARIGMRLRHANICPVYDCGESSGAHFMAMEWVNGATLGDIVKRASEQGGIPLRGCLRIIADVARGLEYAHKATGQDGEPLKLIHRDVSPHNIMVSFRGEVKLLDFGIAKAEEQMHHTQAGAVKGKFAYMAPEQAMGQAIDHRADVFSLGLCLYEVLSLRSAYKRENAASTIAAVMSDPMPSLPTHIPDTSGGLMHIVGVAASKRAGARFATAGLFATALEQHAESLGGLASEREVRLYMRGLFPTEFREGPEIQSWTPAKPSADGTLHLESLDDLIVTEDEAPSGLQEFELADDEEYGNVASLLSERPRPPTAHPAAPVAAAAPVSRVAPPNRSRAIPKVLVTALVSLGLTAGAYFGVQEWQRSRTIVGESVVAVSDNPLLLKQGARILIQSAPSKADVYLDRKHMGQTPLSLTALRKGRYEVRVTRAGFATWSRFVGLGLGDTLTLSARLMPKEQLEK